jgi:site-specific DNA-methyltransferase (adenine-specific)
VWEPFGGLFTASLAAKQLGRRSFAAEIDPTYFQFGVQRFNQAILPHSHREFQDDAQAQF